MWILVQKGESAPSEGHGVVTVTTEPRPLTLADKTVIHCAYVEGPAGTEIELVQR